MVHRRVPLGIPRGDVEKALRCGDGRVRISPVGPAQFGRVWTLINLEEYQIPGLLLNHNNAFLYTIRLAPGFEISPMMRS